MKKPTRNLFNIFLFTFAVKCNVVLSEEIFVSTHGSDGNSGSIDKPLLTLEKARDMAREIREKKSSGNITVYLREGEYKLSHSFTLMEEDSGKEGLYITYSGYKSEKVLLTGGIRLEYKAQKVENDKTLSKLQGEAKKSTLQIDLSRNNILKLDEFDWTRAGPKTKFKNLISANELFSDGKPMVLARWPNKGWVKTGKIISSGSIYSKDKQGNVGGKFEFKNQRLKYWGNETNVWLKGFWKWDWYDDAIPIRGVNVSENLIELGRAHHYGIEEKKRFYAFNAFSELDSPGEYYIDRVNNILYFWPISNGEGNLVLSSLKTPLIQIKNTYNVILKNMVLGEGRESGLQIEGGRNITLDNLVVKNMGNAGIIINGGESHIVKNSSIKNVGTMGVSIFGGKRERLAVSNHYVLNNNINNFGRRIYTKSWGIEISGVGITIKNNIIHDAPHTAIRINGNNHKILENEIYNVCNETSDSGAIYIGRNWTERGNIIKGNYIHDLFSLNKKGDTIAVYLDDLASGSQVIGNIISNLHRGILVGGGRDNVITNNLINKTDIPMSIDSRGLHWAEKWTKPKGILQRRLREIPYKSRLWKKAYPNLFGILDDEPSVPKNNNIQGNAIYNSGPIKIDPIAWVFSNIKNNLELKGQVNIITDYDSIYLDKSINDTIKNNYPTWEKIIIQK